MASHDLTLDRWSLPASRCEEQSQKRRVSCEVRTVMLLLIFGRFCQAVVRLTRSVLSFHARLPNAYVNANLHPRKAFEERQGCI